MKKGFTLLEMVIVMGIIIVLFLITIPNIQSTVGLVNTKGCDAQVKIVDAAILQWQLKHDAIPSSIQDLISDGFINERQSRCAGGEPIHVTNGQARR